MNSVEVAHRADGRGPPLFLVHGIGARMSGWDGIVPGLAPHFTCIRYDLRGHGASPAPPPPYSLAQMVDDLEALRRKLGFEKIHIAGHSLGGMIAPAYARAHPQRTLSLALLSTAAGRDANDRARLRALFDAMQARGVAAVAGEFTARWFTEDFIKARPDAVAARLRQVLDTPPEVFKSVFLLYAQVEMAAWLGEITCPCLALTGALDRGCSPRLNAFIARELADAELVVLDGLKHSILLEAPARVLAPLRNFLLRQR
ncbi:MAG: alpha/beta fold hydrolase [Gammaproteobacteria bacterium]